MTNLSDLFPAGAGKQVSFVADGAISAAGKPVILNGAGTVSPVGPSPGSDVGTPVVFSSSNTDQTAATFDSNSNKVVFSYRDVGNSSYGTSVVATVSGTSISYGTPVVFSSSNTQFIASTFDSSNNKVVIAYQDNPSTSYGTGIVGTVSGTSISFGSSAIFESAGTTYIGATFDSSNNKVVIGYKDEDNSGYGTAVVGTVSGTSISFGTPVVFETDSSQSKSLTFDSTANKVVIAYSDEGGALKYGTAIVGTVSGTSISFGTAVVFEAAESTYISATFDSDASKVVIVYEDVPNTNSGTAIVGTVSGTAISFGTAVVFNSGESRWMAITFDSSSNEIVICFTDGSDGANKGKSYIGTVSGTSISFGSIFTFESGSTNNISTTFDSNSNKVATAFKDNHNSDYGTGVVISTTVTNLTAANFIGISDAAILDTASGNVTIKGGIAATGLTSLTPGSDYYAQTDGTISTVTTSPAVKIGKAMSATSINLEYQS